mgnify:FL=1
MGEHLGGGVVLYEKAVKDVDWELLYSFCEEQLKREHPTHYTEGNDPLTGEAGYINRNGYFFPFDAVDKMPFHMAYAHKDAPDDVKAILDLFEEARDTALWEDYLHRFPLAGKCIWWKIKSHILRYPEGSFIGAHSDVSTDYEYAKPHPPNQIATRTVVSTLAYLNDNYEGGDLIFEYLDIEYKPKRGDLLLFPSNYMGAHRTTTVTKGIRYSHVGWYCHGTPNDKYGESVVDPMLDPERAERATNVYMTEKYNIMGNNES